MRRAEISLRPLTVPEDGRTICAVPDSAQDRVFDALRSLRRIFGEPQGPARSSFYGHDHGDRGILRKIYIRGRQALIERRGDWWKGTDYADVTAFMDELLLEDFAAAADRHEQFVCRCGGKQFTMMPLHEVAACAAQCASCGAVHYIADSKERFLEATKASSATPQACPECNRTHYIVDVASLKDDSYGDADWVVVGAMCASCGLLGSPIQWNHIDLPLDEVVD